MSHRRFRPAFESLETRWTPAVTFTPLDLDGDGGIDDIRIRGDAANNHVTITDDDPGVGIISIDANGDGDFKDKGLGDLQIFFQAGSDSIVFDISLGGANDRVIYNVAADYDQSMRALAVNLGGGADLFQFNTQGSDLTNHSSLSLAVNAGGGNDEVSLGFQEVNESALTIQVGFGGGNDQGGVVFTGGIDAGASVGIAYDLGAGTNSVNTLFQGIGKFGQAVVNVDILGGNDALHRDSVEIGLADDVGSNGTSPSRLNVTSQLFAGNDRFSLFLDHSDFKVDNGSQVHVLAHGGAGNDRLALEPDIGGQSMDIDSAALLDLEFYGDAGNDLLTATMSPFDAFNLTGTLRLRLDGGSGSDQLFGELVNSDSSTGAFDLALFGGGGNDHVAFDLHKNQGTPGFGPADFIVLDGGAGSDTLVNAAGLADVVARLFEAEEGTRRIVVKR